MDDRKATGNAGEQAVAVYLLRRGYQLAARQFRCRFGEIDLIAWSPEGILCFVEVKTRTGNFARGREAVTPAKQRKLRTTAEYYLMQHRLDCPCRFDVAEVRPGKDGAYTDAGIEYIISAF